MAYKNKKHLGGEANNQIITFDKEISNYEKALQEACYAMVKTATKLLEEKAKSFIEKYYESYTPIEEYIIGGKGGHVRGYNLYKSIHTQVQDSLRSSNTYFHKQGNTAGEGQAFTVYGGLRVSAQNMKDYPNEQFPNSKTYPTTSASDVLNWTLLGHDEGKDGYHGWNKDHPGRQGERQKPIQTSIDFVKNLEEYFESDELYDKASEAAWAVIDRYR